MLRWNDVIQFADQGNPTPPRTVRKSDAEWRAQLSPQAYHVTREHGTERAFSSEMCSLLTPGRYECVGCGTLLFDASEKFESGTGWPSFTQPVTPEVIAYKVDRTSTDPKTYPILLVSYLMGCTQYSDANTAANVKAYFSYVLSADGQQTAADNAGSAPLSAALQAKVKPAVDAIK